MTESQVNDLINWLLRQANDIQFGEVTFTVVIHDGKLKRVIRTVAQSELAG